MIKRLLALVIVAAFAYAAFLLVTGWTVRNDLSGVAAQYVAREPDELGAANLVTAIVVAYRGLDTLGEVSVLFLAATGVAALLRRRKSDKEEKKKRRPASEILSTGTNLLASVIIMFGAYIFINGHLSPGGGFQGGAVIASAVLLLFLTYPDYLLKHSFLNVLESASGVGYVIVGVLGLYLAGGFLDNRILPLGEYGKILSAGAIPIIYTFIGLKVGTELAGILENLKGKSS